MDVNGDILHSPPLKRGHLARWSGGGTYVISRTVVVANSSNHPPTLRSLDVFFSATSSTASGGWNSERFTIAGDVDRRSSCARVLVSGEWERSSMRVAWLSVLTVFANA